MLNAVVGRLMLFVGSEQTEAKGQKHGAFAVGEKAEIADADESLGKQVQEESAQKLVRSQCHRQLPVPTFPSKSSDKASPVRSWFISELQLLALESCQGREKKPLSLSALHSGATRSPFLLAVLPGKSDSETRKAYYSAKIDSWSADPASGSPDTWPPFP